ncbi:hypothetical protein [Candidatus Nitrosocosmicus hydrocola]|uniref:hypothetical protein n=1 Tax=Candidatus Nitrosocosmicus hydrocola TaxID=1826872 RepID=UPI0011E5F158|nr:hypothetical protein [Candidatus Nitrosocosmicus hydrocola]
MVNIDIINLYGLWYHSHEEDDSHKKVYRPSTFNFPLSRGIDAFEIRKDGNFVSYNIGPVDVSQENVYQFEIKDENRLCIYKNKILINVMDILSCEKDLLYIKKNLSHHQ